MIPYTVDPSLHSAVPEQASLDDGFSPPRSHGDTPEPAPADAASSLEDALATQSDF